MLIDRMRRRGHSIDEIADEVRHVNRCSKLAAYRMSYGLSQHEAVAKYAEVAGQPIDQPLLSRLEQFPLVGSRRPTVAHLLAFATIYRTTPLRLLDASAAEKLGNLELSILTRHTSRSPVTERQLLRSDRHNAALLRPAESAVDSGVTRDEIERQVRMAARRAFRFSAVADSSNVGVETIDQLRSEIRRIATEYQLSPIHLVLGDLVNLQDIAFRLLEGRQRPAETRELYVLASMASGMMANASHDLGNNHAALMQARTAYVCADNARHDALKAWVRGLQSMISYWAGWAHDAVRYAALGVAAATSVRGTASVWLPALQGRAWALLGNAEEVRSAITQADRARDLVVPNDLDDMGGKLTFPRPRQLYYAADARAWIDGESTATITSASMALSAYEELPHEQRSYVDEAVARTDLALAYAHEGELGGVRENLTGVLDLTPSERVGGILVNVVRLQGLLRDQRYSRSTDANDLREELESFCQMTAATALPH